VELCECIVFIDVCNRMCAVLTCSVLYCAIYFRRRILLACQCRLIVIEYNDPRAVLFSVLTILGIILYFMLLCILVIY